MPGVRIGDSAIVGAGSLVIDNVPAAMLAIGRPAHVVGPIEDYLERRREEIRRGPVFDLDWTVYGQLTKERQTETARRLADRRAAYVPEPPAASNRFGRTRHLGARTRYPRRVRGPAATSVA
jgi:hypothetical protein